MLLHYLENVLAEDEKLKNSSQINKGQSADKSKENPQEIPQTRAPNRSDTILLPPSPPLSAPSLPNSVNVTEQLCSFDVDAFIRSDRELKSASEEK